LVKPFGSAELVARVEAVLRRTGTRTAAQTPETILIKGVSVDFAKHEAMLPDGSTSTLTPQECDFLRFLAERRDRAVQRSELQNLLWKGHVDFSSRAIDMLVGRLREKLGDDSRESKIIVTVRGSGYRLGDQ
jgi:DNA-binding response OmpR family regulator